jgi:hypothetical protein
MDFQALGSIGELLGGIAVVASLIYVASQIRQNTEVASVTNHQNALSIFSTFTDWVVRDPKLADLYRHGLHEFDSLSASDQFRFSQLMLHQFLHYNYQRESHENGLLDDALFSTWEASLAAQLKMPGGASWWAGAKDVVLPAARESLDRAIATAPPLNELWPGGAWDSPSVDDHQARDPEQAAD